MSNQHLLLVRVHLDDGRSFWLLPGGGSDPRDDAPEATVRREVREETGLKVIVESLLSDVEAHPDDTRYVRWRTYLCSIENGVADAGAIDGSARISEVHWLPLFSEAEWPAEIRSDRFLSPQLVRIAEAMGPAPFFPVATHKLIVMSICTFGLYELYWSYKNWVRIRGAGGERISPFWRAFFMPLTNFSLFDRVLGRAAKQHIHPAWSAGVLATLYLVLTISWRLPDPWWLLSMGSVAAIIPVLRTTREVNVRSGSRERDNSGFSGANIAVIIIGGLLFLLAVLGSFSPE